MTLNNLRDSLPYPCTKSDAEEYIALMLSADKNLGHWRQIYVTKINEMCFIYIGLKEGG